MKTRQPAARRFDARVVLRAERAAVTSLFDRFEHSRSTTRTSAIVAEICRALTLQARLEDEVLYPALAGNAHVPEARRQQAILRALIAEVQTIEPGDDGYDANVRLISEYVRHQRDEQDEMLPRGRLSKLGGQLANRKQELLAELRDFGGWD
jgi:hypothetical protein